MFEYAVGVNKLALNHTKGVVYVIMKKKEIKKVKKKKNSSKKKYLPIMYKSVGLLFLFLVIIAAVLFATESSRLQTHFGHHDLINGKSYFGLNASGAAERMDTEFQNYKIHIMENDTEIYSLTYGEAGYSLDRDVLKAELNQVISNQKPGLHLMEKPENHIISYPVNRSDDVFAAAFTSDKLSGERTDSTDAYIRYDEEQGAYVIVPETYGNSIRNDAFQALISNIMDQEFAGKDIPENLYITLDSSVYTQPSITSAQEDLQNQLNSLNQQINQFRSASITYTFGSSKEVVDWSLISTWLTVNDTGIQLSEEAVREYIKQLASKYNTIYRDRNFTTTGGQTVKMEHNEYGYRIDQEDEYQQLIQELAAGTVTEREPVYNKTGFQRNGTDDLCGTYIEVSISQQHLWLYKNGVLITETDVVTGTDKPEFETLKGAWTIALKASPYTLSSDIYGYKVNVNYWMPFVYGQGLHDLSTRKAFGGQIYKTNGSHGCINLPLNQAKIIYETIDAGYPILIY